MSKAKDPGPLSIVAVDIGNTNTAIGRWDDGNVKDIVRTVTRSRTAGDDAAPDGIAGDRAAEGRAVFDALDQVRDLCENEERQAIVIASVVPSQTERLTEYVDSVLNLRPFVVGENTPVPIEMNVRKPDEVGVDRLCAGAAAFWRLERGCVVVDIGSAVTIDVIDDDGVFQGGAILPGLGMWHKVLAGETAGLPHVEPAVAASVIGKDTHEAIGSGGYYGLAGAIRAILEQIATDVGQWPFVVATGGGVEFLRPRLDFVDRFVPDLCLIGVGLAFVKRYEEPDRG